MIAISLVHIALMTNFAAAHFAGLHFDFAAAKSTPAVEKVVIREMTLSEKLELGIDSINQPDKEIAEVKEQARTLASALGNCERPPKVSWETPNLRSNYSYMPNWNELFAVKWDEDGGFSFGGRYFPKPDINSTCRGGGLDLSFEINR